MQPSENWGPTHRNLERLQRRSISSANQTSRKNSSVRRDPTTNTGTTTSASSSLKLNQSSQQQQHQQQQIAQQNNPHSLPFPPPPHSILHSARQSNGGTLGAHNGAQGGAHAHANPNLIFGSGKTVSIQNGGPTAIISSSGKSVGHLSKAKANRPSPLTMVPTATANLPHPPFHPPLGARTSGNGNGGGDCSSSSSELTTVTPTNLSVKSGGHVVILDGAGGGCGGNGGSRGHTPKLPQSQFTTATTGLRSSGQGGDTTSTPSSSLPSSANPVNSRNRSFDNPFFDGSVQGYRGQQPPLPPSHQGISRSNSDANKETRI